MATAPLVQPRPAPGPSAGTFIRRSLILNYLVLGIGAFTMVVPFVWMITTAFKPQAEWITFPPKFLPVEPTLENFHKAAESLDIFTLYRNTLYIAFVKSFINLYVSCLAGYVFGKFDFRGKDILFYMILATWIIPFEVYMIPLYLMVNQQGMADTRLALIIPELSSAYAIFMYRQFMFTIPNALIDAARIDGAGEWYIWHRIIIPLSIPVLATLAVFYFMWNFNDFLWPLIVLVSPKKFVLSLGLTSLFQEKGSFHGLIMAGAAMASIPIMIIFLFLQRYITEGIALSGMK